MHLFWFVTSALDGGEWSATRPGRFSPLRKSSPHCTYSVGATVGPRDGLCVLVEEKSYISVIQQDTQYLMINLLNPTGHVLHQQFNIQQLYVLLTLYLCVLYLSENKQRLVPLTA